MVDRCMAQKAWLIVVCCFFLLGCKKSASEDTGLGDAKPVVLSITDIGPKGEFNQQGVQKLEAEASTPAIAVVVSRTKINDPALAQIAKYKNVRKVQAIG